MVSELEDQIEPLREQSEKAIRYKELRETLKSSEIAMYVHQIDQIYLSWNEASQKLEKLVKEQTELSTIVNQHDAHLEKHRWETRRLEEELEKLQESLLVLSEEFEKCEGHGEVLKERKRNYVANQQQLSSTIALQEQRKIDKEAELSEQREKIIQIGAQLFEFQAKLTAEEQRLLGVNGGISSSPEDQLKGELLETLNRMAQARNEIRYAEQQTESIGRRLERLDDERQKWADQREKITVRKQELTAKLETTVKEIEDIRQQYVQLTQSLKNKQGLLDDALGMVRKWEQKLDALTSRRDTMKEMANDYDGFMQGVKEVLKAKSRKDLRGIRGAIAELVKVPADVEIAIETALGGALQNIVVETEADGREAISFLKRRQMGRATFLPMNVIRGRSISDNEISSLRSAKGFIGHRS